VEIANAEIYNDLHVISLVCDATDLWIAWPGLVVLPLCLLFLFLHLLLLVLFLVFLATLVSHVCSLSAIIFRAPRSAPVFKRTDTCQRLPHDRSGRTRSARSAM
jgi:small-conductance mechanosensitive channel